MNSELPFLPAADSLIYTAINKLCNNDWLVLYPREFWVKLVEILSSFINIFTHA